MAIVSSEFALEVAQIDGRRFCTERHTDNLGVIHRVVYLSAVGTDNNAVMLARVSILNQALIDDDVQRLLNTDAAPVLRYATMTQLGNYAREQYRSSVGYELAKIAKWIVNRINEGTWTATQVRNFFGLTQTQWNTLKAKMDSLITALNQVDAAVGE